jgi:hypothetical protein
MRERGVEEKNDRSDRVLDKGEIGRKEIEERGMEGVVCSVINTEKSRTFLGGRMAMADLGVMERWWWWGLGSFSPLRDRRIAWRERCKKIALDWMVERR